MRKLITILIIITIFIIGTNYIVENYLNKVKIKEKNNLVPQKINQEEKERQKKLKEEKEKNKIEQEKLSKEKIEDKLDLLRKRYILKGLIQKGDTYLENSQHLLALKSYLGAIKQNPDDKIIIKKIGDTYYEMKKFKIAYNYYKDLINTNIIDKDKLAITYINTFPQNRKQLDFSKIYKEIESFKLDKDNNFFYKTSIECLFNKDTCEKKFENYSKYYRGKNKKIIDIKKAFQNYYALKIKEQYFKDTQILAAIFKNNLYGISNILAEDILKTKKNYLPVLKIIAKGNFNLGNYKQAKEYLLEYNKIDDKDPRVNYMLGIINIKLHEYILSNIYFIKALKSGYKNKADISRRLIYNYYLAGDKKRMMIEFKKLIDENKEQLNPTDYSLAIYYSIIAGQDKQANKWTNEALKLFPKNDSFYGYKGWIFKENNDLEKAEYYLMKGYKLNPHNPLINLNLGLIEYEKGNFLKAKIYLKNTLGEDPNGEFGKFATKKLEEILLEQEKIKQEAENNF